MPQDYPSALRSARQTTRLTQEQAAELADVSLESYKAYEYGGRMPPRETAVRLCEALEAPWLALEYLKEMAEPLGVLPESIRVQSLPTAVITLNNRVFAFADRHRDRQLLTIAEDGIIDECERPEFDAIVADLRETIAAAYQVIYADGAKKERPDGGTSKRSVLSGKPENDCKNSISHSRGNASPVLSKGVYAR